MRNALRGLLADTWVIPLAAAVAIAFATVDLLRSIIDVLFDLAVQSQRAASREDSVLGLDRLFDEPMMITIADRVVYLQPLLENAVFFAATIVGAALALRWSDRAEPVDVDS